MDMNNNESKITIKELKNEFCSQIIRSLYQNILSYVRKNAKPFEDEESKFSSKISEDFRFLNTMNLDRQKDDMFADVLEQGGILGENRISKYIYGLGIDKSGELVIATEYIEKENEEKKIWTKEDFCNEKNWEVFKDSKTIVGFSTLLCIADTIEQY